MFLVFEGMTCKLNVLFADERVRKERGSTPLFATKVGVFLKDKKMQNVL